MIYVIKCSTSAGDKYLALPPETWLSDVRAMFAAAGISIFRVSIVDKIEVMK